MPHDQLHSAEVVAQAQASKRAKSAAYRAAGVPTRSEAIAAFCAECIYDPGAGGTWRAQVAACQSRRCPLWPYRPGVDPLAEMPGHSAVTLRDVLANKRHDWNEPDPGEAPDKAP